MLLAGCTHGEHALDKATSRGALRAVTALAPQHRRAQRALGRVVRRLNSLHVQKRPQRLPARNQIRAQAPKRVLLVLTLLDQFPHRLLDGQHHPLQGGSLDGVELNDEARSRDVFDSLSGAGEARVTVERNGVSQELVLNLAEIAVEAEQIATAPVDPEIPAAVAPGPDAETAR